MGPLSVLVMVASTDRRGAEIGGVDFVENLHRRGHSGRLVAITGDSTRQDPRAGWEDERDRNNVHAEVLGRSRWSLRSHRRIRALARDSDVVVAMGSITLLAAVAAMVGLDRPLVYRSIGDPSVWAGRGLRRWRTSLYLRATDRIATLSERQHAQYEHLYGIDAAKLAAIPNSRSPERFRPASTAQRDEARAMLDLSADDKVVLFIGSLTAEKRIDLAIAALSELPPDYVLLVAGDGADRQRAETAAARLGPGRVRLLGRVADVVPLYRASDVVLLTSSTEGVPGVLIEAGLCGVASVATNVGLVSEVVRDALTGCLVDEDTPASIARAVERAYRDREQLGSAARKWCLDRFSDEQTITTWEDTLSSVVRR